MTKKKNSLSPVVYFFVCLTTMISFNMLLTNNILHNIFLSTNSTFIDIVYVQNTGAAFSSFQHSANILAIVSVLAVLFVLWELFKNMNRYSLTTYFFCAMLCSGIICNTYERFALGYVRDFINLKFIEFPVFNISDILINVSVLAIMILIITKKYKKNA